MRNFLEIVKKKIIYYNKLKDIENEFKPFKTGDAYSDIAQKSIKLNKEWLSYYWPKYNKEAHVGLAEMYINDERFTYSIL